MFSHQIFIEFYEYYEVSRNKKWKFRETVVFWVSHVLDVHHANFFVNETQVNFIVLHVPKNYLFQKRNKENSNFLNIFSDKNIY